MWVLTREALRRCMIRCCGNDTTTAAPFKNSVLGLLKDAYAPTVASVYAGDVKTHEANFDGYALSPQLTFNGPFVGQGGKEIEEAGAVLVEPTGSATVNMITGQFLLASDSATLLGVEMYDAPIPLPGSSSAFVTVPMLGLPPDTIYGQSLVSP